MQAGSATILSSIQAGQHSIGLEMLRTEFIGSEHFLNNYSYHFPFHTDVWRSCHARTESLADRPSCWADVDTGPPTSSSSSEPLEVNERAPAGFHRDGRIKR